MVQGQLQYCGGKKFIFFLLPYAIYPHTRINPRSKCGSKIIRFQKDNSGKYLHDFGMGKEFLNRRKKAIII